MLQRVYIDCAFSEDANGVERVKKKAGQNSTFERDEVCRDVCLKGISVMQSIVRYSTSLHA